jgi:hypothetical protein
MLPQVPAGGWVTVTGGARRVVRIDGLIDADGPVSQVVGGQLPGGRAQPAGRQADVNQALRWNGSSWSAR